MKPFSKPDDNGKNIKSGFKLTRKKISYKFASIEKENNTKQWIKSLNKFVLREGFLENYEVIKRLGKGSFA